MFSLSLLIQTTPIARPSLVSAARFSPRSEPERLGLGGYSLALLWQIYSRCFSLQIHFLQCGHRCGGGRAMSSRMASRTAGNVGRGGSPARIGPRSDRDQVLLSAAGEPAPNPSRLDGGR